MKAVWFGSCVVALQLASGLCGARAADLPSPHAAPPAPVAVERATYDWTGFYVGANVGANITSNWNADTEGDTTFPFDNNNGGLVPITLDTGTGGVVGGLEGGYDRQYGAIVGGVEADISAIQAGGSGSFTSGATLMGSTFTTSASEKLDYFGTLRLRAGYTPIDRWLVFATGGLAYGGIKTSTNVVMNSAPANAWNGSDDQVRLGYVVGGGLEYALTQNISLKGEYLYYNLGSHNTSAPGNASVQAVPALRGLVYDSKTTAAGSILRVGVDYKF